MPYSVAHLLENQGTLVVIRRDDTLAMALDLMIEHDFSQLPVVDENGILQGLITHESILRAARNFNAKLERLSVRDALVSASCSYREDDLFDLLDKLKRTNAVIIVEPEGYVSGIVTSYDAASFLRNRTEDLMHVEDIEFIIKELIRRPYTDGKNSKPFDELNLGDYINLLVSKDIWKSCAPILNVEKESLYELLVRIRQTRNDLAHFRSEISPRSRDELKYCAIWLRRRYQEYEKDQGGKFIRSLLAQHEQADIIHAARDEPAAYEAFIEEPKRRQERKPASPGRYAALTTWLAQQKQERVILTFEQIGELIGSPLPDSASRLRAWWGNDMTSHAHSAAWLEAGWQVVYVDLATKQVIFARLGTGKLPQ